MSRFHRLALIAITTALAGLLMSCEEGGTVTIVGADGEQIEVPDGTIVAASEVAETPPPTLEPVETPTPPPATPTAQPASSQGNVPDDLRGTPYSTADLRAAIESAGATFEGLAVDAMCPNTSVPELTFLASNGNETGPVFSVWVYPDSTALAGDWATGNAVNPLTEPCSLPTASVYWNRNVVLAYRSEIEGGTDVGPAASGRNTIPVQAFLNLTP